MAKTSTSKAPKSEKIAQAKMDKQEKRQQKHEANLKQKIKFTQKDLQKAERKVLKAKTDVDALAGQLQELNEKLTHSHTPSHTSAKSKKEKSHTDTSEQTAPVNLVPEETASSAQESPVSENMENTESSDNKPADGDSYVDSSAIEEFHQASLPPAEGRSDINESQDSSATNGASEEPKTESSAEEKSEADQQEPEKTEEHHTTSRRTSHRRTTTHETHES